MLTIKTQKGAEIVLSADNSTGKVTASHSGKPLGEVLEVATKELGWHLRAGSVAITVSAADVPATKAYINKCKLAHYEANKTPEQHKHDADLRDYYDSYDRVINASYGSN